MGDQDGRRCWGLLRRRVCVVPTWRGWLALAGASGLLVVTFLRVLHPLLTVTQPVAADFLVVEGWGPDFVMQYSIGEFHRGGYRQMIVTGGPLEKGSPLMQYRTTADLGAETIRELGLRTNVLALPAPEVRKDRTYVSALVLKRWFRQQGLTAVRFNLLTIGPHARRTRMMFREAFGKDAEIGIIAVPDERYDEAHWWVSSQGFRTTIDELVAYLYAVTLFRPPAEADLPAELR
ncbi:MAG TPA: ElyC/SanA/YdcF family protein [Candidatus Limnocylindria bacterium]|jgi:hypothetical protein|nr:ElyC/SanA/YdcF family protein [Candidatus Limnocylindria bacterium]